MIDRVMSVTDHPYLLARASQSIFNEFVENPYSLSTSNRPMSDVECRIGVEDKL